MDSLDDPAVAECFVCLHAEPPSPSPSPSPSPLPSRWVRNSAARRGSRPEPLLRPCACNAYVHWECWRSSVGAREEALQAARGDVARGETPRDSTASEAEESDEDGRALDADARLLRTLLAPLACAVCRRTPEDATVLTRAWVVRLDVAVAALLTTSVLVVATGTRLLVAQSAAWRTERVAPDLLGPERAMHLSLAFMMVWCATFSVLLWKAHCLHTGRVRCWSATTEPTRVRVSLADGAVVEVGMRPDGAICNVSSRLVCAVGHSPSRSAQNAGAGAGARSPRLHLSLVADDTAPLAAVP